MDKLIVEAFTLEFTPESITRVEWKGEASEAAMRALREYGQAAREVTDEGTPTKALVDATGATGIDRGARKELIQIGRDKPWDRAAFVGVRFELKVMLELITKALRIMNLGTAETAFVDTVEEGLAWLEGE